MARSDAWMPLYVSKYERATSRLSLAEDGAYMRLIRDYWVNGAPPDDDATIARILRVERREWLRIRPALERFFDIRDGHWFHDTVERELGKATAIIEKRREAGRQGGRPPKQTESKPKPNGFSDGKQTGSQNETPLPEPTPDGVLSDANASSVVGRPSDDVAEAVALWNEVAGRHGLPKAKTIDKARKAAIRARLADGGLDTWREALAAVERSPHCRGENDRGWRADLDFVCQPKSWRRLLEGSYGSDKPSAAPEIAFAGPADVIQAVVGATDAQRAATLLGRCSWQDVPERALVSSNNVVVNQLREGDVWKALRDIGVDVRLERAA